MIHIDSKITIWDRFSIDDEHKDELLEFLKEHPEATANDIIDWASDQGIDGEHSTITETGEPLTPGENGGKSTVEVGQSTPHGTEPLWDNTPPKVEEQPEEEGLDPIEAKCAILNNMFPGINAASSEEWDDRKGGIWFKQEDARHADDIPYFNFWNTDQQVHPAVAHALEKLRMFAEPNDPGTWFAYPID